MTVIASIRTPTSILMGGDSAQNTGGSIMLTSEEKVFINGDYCFGVAGSPRVAERVRYEFVPPRKIASSTWTQFMVQSFLPRLKDALGVEAPLEKSAILVGTKGGGIYEIDHTWIAKQSQDGYAAVGSGGDYALGSLHSTRGDPKRRLLKALNSAAHFNAYIRAPFTILELVEGGLEEELWGSIEQAPDREAFYAISTDDRGWSDAADEI
jgi:ATP-dependent protease HslVU (ClpYQ) peptidase subunit